MSYRLSPRLKDGLWLITSFGLILTGATVFAHWGNDPFWSWVGMVVFGLCLLSAALALRKSDPNLHGFSWVMIGAGVFAIGIGALVLAKYEQIWKF